MREFLHRAGVVHPARLRGRHPNPSDFPRMPLFGGRGVPAPVKANHPSSLVSISTQQPLPRFFFAFPTGFHPLFQFRRDGLNEVLAEVQVVFVGIEEGACQVGIFGQKLKNLWHEIRVYAGWT